jgi:hypothetical protein
MLDAAQSVPHIPVDVQALDVDFMAFSIHKMLGPTGLGICYMKDPTCLTEGFFPSGGGTVTRTFDDQVPIYADSPARYEAGLQNWSGIIGAGAAVDYLQDKIHLIHQHQVELNRLVTEALWDAHMAGTIGMCNDGHRYAPSKCRHDQERTPGGWKKTSLTAAAKGISCSAPGTSASTHTASPGTPHVSDCHFICIIRLKSVALFSISVAHTSTCVVEGGMRLAPLLIPPFPRGPGCRSRGHDGRRT